MTIGRPNGVRLPVSAGGLVAKTYAEYQAAIAALPTAAWGTDAGVATRAFRTTAAAATGSMVGSSWFQSFHSGAPSRLVQHGVQTLEIFNAQVSGGFELYLEITSASSLAVGALTRHGYTSAEGAAANPRGRVTRLIRWDDTLKKAFESDPSIGGAETEWVF